MNDLNQNEQRATGVDRQAKAPTCLDPTAPGDGGFLTEPAVTVDRSTFCGPGKFGPVTFRGNLFFNTQSIVEAADTGPFFHDNSAATLEQVIDHYRSDAFNNSVTGAGNGFLISDDQRNQIAAFLRAVNTLDNIRAATASIRAALRPRGDIREGHGRRPQRCRRCNRRAERAVADPYLSDHGPASAQERQASAVPVEQAAGCQRGTRASPPLDPGTAARVK